MNLSEYIESVKQIPYTIDGLKEYIEENPDWIKNEANVIRYLNNAEYILDLSTKYNTRPKNRSAIVKLENFIKLQKFLRNNK